MKRAVATLLFTLTVVVNTAAQQPHPFLRPVLPVDCHVVTLNVAQVAPPVPPRTVDTKKTTLYVASSLFLWGSTAWDAAETDRLTATGRYIEGNPILRRHDGSLNKPLKFAISGAGQVLSYYYYKKHRVWTAICVNLAFAAPQFIAGWVSSSRH